MNVYMARQPIFDTENHVYGYELLYRSNGVQNQYNGVDGDASTADVITNAFFGLDIRDIIGNSKAFINFTGNLLKRGVPKMISPELVVVEVLENLMMDEKLLAACQELKERGYTLALDDFEYDSSYSQLFELGDIVKIDFRTPQKSIEGDGVHLPLFQQSYAGGEDRDPRGIRMGEEDSGAASCRDTSLRSL